MFGDYIIRFRWVLALLLLAVLAGALYLIPNIEFAQNTDSYFPDKDPDLEFYYRMTAELGDENDLVFAAVHRENGIFDSVFLAKFHSFTLACGQLPFVGKVRSLTNMNDMKRTPFGNLPSPFLHLSKPALFPADSIKLLNDKRLLKRFVSADLKTLPVIMETAGQMNGKKREELISALENLGESYQFSEMYIIGRKYFDVIHNRVLAHELKKGLAICICLVIILLGILYRSLWGIMLPVLVYIFSSIIFLGYLVLRGHPMDIMTNLAPTILLIVSVSDVIHFLSKYEDQIKAGLEKRVALRNSLNHIGFAIFLTSFTTAIGFLTLTASNLPALRQFGGDIAVGVLLAFLITLIMVPFVLWYIPEHAIQIRKDWYQWWHNTADGILYLIRNNPKWIIWSTILLIVIGIVGLPQINTNNFFVTALPKQHEATHAIDFFEKNLGGIRTFEIGIIPKKEKKLNDLIVLREIEKLHYLIDSLPRTGGVYSPVTFYKSLNRAWNGGRNNAYVLPNTQAQLDQQEQKFEKPSGALFHRILNEEKNFGKVSVQMNDPGRGNIRVLNKEVDNWISANMDTTLLETRIIGASAMADKIQEHSIRNLFTGLSLSLLAIGLLIFILYQNWKLVLIVITINLFPLIITGAVMALLGIELVIATSIIFTIGFVIAVDDTIHFIGRYRMERTKGLSNADAITITIRETGRAMLLTSAVLFFGFAQLITSSFRDATAVGILVSFMLIIAFLIDLLLGPLLLNFAFSSKEPSRS